MDLSFVHVDSSELFCSRRGFRRKQIFGRKRFVQSIEFELWWISRIERARKHLR
jgi:hypothetical protein